MPSATSGGWPYPLSNEPVRDGWSGVKNLADEANQRLGNKMILAGSNMCDIDSLGRGSFFLATPFAVGTKPVLLYQCSSYGYFFTIVPNYGQQTHIFCPFNLQYNNGIVPTSGSFRIEWIAVGVAP